MLPFTTRQREILKIILDVRRPIGSVELARLLRITPRQVNYSIKGVKIWLKQQGQDLNVLPGVGFSLDLNADQARSLVQKISVHADVQIVLSVSQRQQLLALFLLTRREPVILAQLEQLSHVSRVTILKDLDEIEGWLQGQDLPLVRKPHFGIQVLGDEHHRQQALAKLLWGETPFSDDPITRITHSEGLTFPLQRDARLLPLVAEANAFLSALPLRRAIGLVAKAEEQLGGRFTDDAVLHLALVFAILSERVRSGCHLEANETLLSSLQSAAIWRVASHLADRLGREAGASWKPADVTGLAVEMLAAPRNVAFPGNLDLENDSGVLSELLMDRISRSFGMPELRHDLTLQNGLLNNVVPACFRQRFRLWFPVALNNAGLPERYAREHAIAREIADLVLTHTGVSLPHSEVNNLVVLLRAAFLRNRSSRIDRVIVICPSGMATAQLLIARLHARFPNLTNLEVISLRDLSPALVSTADLILTTVPLPRQYANHPKIIQVHPLLMPNDIETINQFLS